MKRKHEHITYFKTIYLSNTWDSIPSNQIQQKQERGKRQLKAKTNKSQLTPSN